MTRAIPTPPGSGLLNALRFGRQTFRYLEGIQSRYEDLAKLSIPGRPPIVIVTNPTLVHDVLARTEEFGRVPAQESAALIAEHGLVQSEGDLWRQQRSIMGPAFTGRGVRAYADATGRWIDDLAGDWAAAGEQEVNLHREITSTTVRVASDVLFGEDIGEARAREFHEWMRAAGEEFEFGLDVAAPEWLPTRVSPEFREAARGIRDLADELIEANRAALAADDSAGPPMNMLGMLLRAEDDPDVEFSKTQIRDEVTTLLIAGHETTALSISYTLSLLSWHPEIRREIRAEAREVLGEGPPTYADVADLDLTQRAYREALRLYPPAWAVFRRTTGDVRLGEYGIERGSAVITPQWSIHRDPRYFEEPRQFDPDRWARRRPGEVPAYFPFSSGPHACIGKQFALSGATLVVARLVRDLDIEVDRSALDDLMITPTLRPRSGVDATVTPVD
jgi:cytochrome P450